MENFQYAAHRATDGLGEGNAREGTERSAEGGEGEARGGAEGGAKGGEGEAGKLAEFGSWGGRLFFVVVRDGRVENGADCHRAAVVACTECVRGDQRPRQCR
mmetsp:Transcript_28177/g.36345  ORF Transcript_28177/g.36345 Transcript_28177/m.36345 type:complete len:102 (+) Transcript_28177:534-839(+)